MSRTRARVQSWAPREDDQRYPLCICHIRRDYCARPLMRRHKHSPTPPATDPCDVKLLRHEHNYKVYTTAAIAIPSIAKKSNLPSWPAGGVLDPMHIHLHAPMFRQA